MQLLPLLLIASLPWQETKGSSPQAGSTVEALPVLVVLLLAIVVLGAGLALLWFTIQQFARASKVGGELQRLATALSEAPQKEGTPLYQHFRDSAHHEVIQLKGKVEELRTMVQYRDKKLAEMLASLEANLREFTTAAQIEESRCRKLEQETELFREGFLASHNATVIGRMIYLFEKVEQVEDAKLREVTISELEDSLRFCRVSPQDPQNLLGKRVDESLATAVEVRGSKDSSNQQEEGVICEVHSRPWAVDGTPGGPRIIRKGVVDVFRYVAPAPAAEASPAPGEDPPGTFPEESAAPPSAPEPLDELQSSSPASESEEASPATPPIDAIQPDTLPERK
jgi:hypothetical protein